MLALGQTSPAGAPMPPAQPAWRLTLEALAQFPRPGAGAPARLAFSPDGRLLSYLFSGRGDLALDLWALDLATGERRVLARPPGAGTTDATANPEEALRRERERLRAGGVTHYRWAKDADRLVVPINGQIYHTTSGGETLRLLAPAGAPAVDPRPTPEGAAVVFVREGELWVVEVATGETRRLTFDAGPTRANG